MEKSNTANVETNQRDLHWCLCFEHLQRQKLLFKILKSRQNERHSPNNIFKWVFLNENIWILIQILLKFVPMGLINIIRALVQIMAWCRTGNKPLSKSMMVSILLHLCVTQLLWVKTLRPKHHKGQHFAENTFSCIFRKIFLQFH